MSAGILPDMYRYTARKSTVSKNPKPTNISLCNNSPSSTHFSIYRNDNNIKQSPILDAFERSIKVEKEIPEQLESFTIQHDNEIEQMIIGENSEQTNEEIIYDIIEQIKNHIIQTSSPATTLSNSNQIMKNFSTDTQDVHDIVGLIVNQINENDNNKLKTIEDNVNSFDEITPMESDQPTSTNSRFRIDHDILEVEETSTYDNSHSCTCRCHKVTSPLNQDYVLFEKALEQARLEQQQEKSLNNNRLIQTLKRQHEELVNIYQQNKNHKPTNTTTKIDREQQTNKLNHHDSQVQTDSTPIKNSKLISPKQQKSLVTPPTNSHIANTNGPLLATRNTTSTAFNSNSTSSTSVPRSSSTAVATTTVTSKTSTVTTKSTTIINATPPVPPPSSTLSSTIPHDVVDLTEEDEDETTNNRTTPAQRITATRQSTSFIQPSTSTTTSTATTPATATRLRPTATVTSTTTTTTTATRTPRPTTTIPNGQVFPLRPLPENNPCDHTIARPHLNITQENSTVRLTWNLQSTPMESIQNYEIYAYKQNATVTTSDWKKIGTVKSMRLPMAVTLKEFQSNSHYAFAVRAVSMSNSIGPFCEPKTIFTGNTSVQPLHTSQLLNVST